MARTRRTPDAEHARHGRLIELSALLVIVVVLLLLYEVRRRR